MAPPYGYHTTATEVAADLASNIRGKTVLTTGVTPGSLGAQFVETIAAYQPKLLILASRNLETMKTTAEAITNKHSDVAIRTVQLDLGSLASVRKAAAEVVKMQKSEGVVIDVLMLNAGIMAAPYSKTVDGFETQFATNHLGHFLFGNLIIPGMLGAGRRPRVISVSSEGHGLGPVRFLDVGFQNGEYYDKWHSYGQAKTANALYALSLAEKLGLKGLLALSVNPGVIMTNLGRHMDPQGEDMKSLLVAFRSLGNPQGFPEHWETHPLKTVDEGTSTHIVAAFGNGLEESNGRFLWDAQVAKLEEVRPWARDSIEAEKLWKMSEEMVGEEFTF